MVLLLVIDEEMNQRDIKWPTQGYKVRAWLSLALKEALSTHILNLPIVS